MSAEDRWYTTPTMMQENSRGRRNGQSLSYRLSWFVQHMSGSDVNGIIDLTKAQTPPLYVG